MAIKNITTGEIREEEPTQELADQGFVPIDPNILNSATLQTEPEADFETFEESQPDDTTKLEVSEPVELTETGQEAQGFSEQIMSARERLLGESAFTAEQEEEAGLIELRKTQTDLTARMKALQNEALAIPMQLQEESIGRGRTRGGLAPLQTSRLRANAIQTLTTASQLEASRGNIATAQTLVDRAVAQKFDPIRERLAVSIANLETLRDSPLFTAEEKALADKQLKIQQAEEDKVAEEEAVYKAIQAVGIEAAKFGVDAVTLNKIQQAETELEATQIAQAAGALIEEKQDRIDIVRKALEEGFTQIKSPEELEGLTEDQIFRTTDNQGNEMIFKKPDESVDFTRTQKQKLEQAGLADASRQEQLDFLFGKTPKVIKPKSVKPEDEMAAQLSTVVGSDGFISPDDYTIARNAWITEGLNPTVFDTKFKGFRNPNNPNYVITKKKSSPSGGGQTP